MQLFLKIYFKKKNFIINFTNILINYKHKCLYIFIKNPFLLLQYIINYLLSIFISLK